MVLEMVFNELSIDPPADGVGLARQRMTTFVQTIWAASQAGISRPLRCHSDLQTIELTHNYPIAKWRNDNAVDIEVRRFWRSLTTQYPYEQALLPSIAERQSLCECLFEQHHASGFTWAYLLDALALSMQSAPQWNETGVSLTVRSLTPTDDLQETLEIVHHASSPAHVHGNRDWIRSRLLPEIKNGTELWQESVNLYPRLEFCARIEDQILRLPSEDMLRQVMNWLGRLNQYCTTWNNGPFNYRQISSTGVSPESGPTLTQYAADHTFVCPDGQERLFSWHCKLGLLQWRVFFSIDVGPGRMIIGHIGEKLPNVKYPT